MDVRPDPWLGDIVGYPVFRVVAASPAQADASAQVAAHLASHGRRAMYYAKIDTRDIESARDLAALGFYVVDTNVTLTLAGGPRSRLPMPEGVVVEDGTGETGAAAADIAGSAMQYSRFHLDPAVPIETAHRIKYEWIRNYAQKKRGETLLVARVNGKVCGFLAVLRTEHGDGPVRTIDLIAVDAGTRRQGVGRALVAAFVNRYGASSAHLQVGTQIANLPSIALYQALGFALSQTSYVLHHHSHARQGSA